jgi:hypothetical protein
MAFDGSQWGRRVKATGQSPIATATGFVALFTLDNFQGTRNEIVNGGSNSALNGGGDIRVSTDDAGTNQLPLEIVSFVVSATPSLQDIQFWVRFDSYEAAQREVWVFYNRAGQVQPPVTDTYGRNAVWSDYEAALHCQDTNWTDSTGNGDLSPDGATPPTVVDTSLGKAYRFNASDSTHITRALTSSITSAPITVQATFINRGTPAYTLYAGGISGTAGGRDFSIGGISGNSSQQIRDTFPVNQGRQFVVSGNAGAIGDEYHVDSVFDAGNLTSSGWINGTFGTDTIARTLSTTLVNVGIGGRIDGSPEYYDVDVVEFRVLTVARDQNHLDLEHDNRFSSSTFWTMGEPEDTGGGVTPVEGTGDLTSSVATLAGVGESFSVVSGIGTLTSQNSTLDAVGQSFSTLDGVGSLVPDDSSVSGVGLIIGAVTGSGDLGSTDATITSTGVSFTLHSGSGSLEVGGSNISSLGNVLREGTGNLPTEDSLISGIGEILGAISGAGDLTSNDSAIASTGVKISVGTGDLSSTPSQITGIGDIVGAIVGTASLESDNSVVVSDGYLVRSGGGNLETSLSTISGEGNIEGAIEGTGDLVSGGTQITSVGIKIISGQGDLSASPSLVDGEGSIITVILGEGELQSLSSSLRGREQTIIIGVIAPPERTVYVDKDTRSYLVDANNRTFIVQ